MNPNFVRVGKSNKTVNSGMCVTVSSCSKKKVFFPPGFEPTNLTSDCR